MVKTLSMESYKDVILNICELVCTKLRWLNWHRVKFWLKSDWNHLLINFFDQKLSSNSEIDSSRSEIHQQVPISSKEIKNILNLIKKVNINQLFWAFSIKFDYFNLLIDFFQCFNWLFYLLSKNRLIIGRFNQKEIEIRSKS